MKLLLQRVNNAKVEVDGQLISQIGFGILVFVGFNESDTADILPKAAQKIANLRIFEDEFKKTNLNSAQVNAELMVVSQFTLYGDCKKGNRPDFFSAARPKAAQKLYELFIEQCQKHYSCVKCGIFGADMKISLTNDGPFTVILEL